MRGRFSTTALPREIAQQCIKLVRAATSKRRRFRVIAIFAGQHGQRDAALARQCSTNARCRISTESSPTEQADDDYPSVSGNTFDPQIDRHRMAQVAQMREPHARQHSALGLPSRRKTSKIAVGERQHHDVARRLGEVNRCDNLVARLVELVVSRCIVQPKPFNWSSACVTPARSRPFRPMTTSRPLRISDADHGRSYWCVTRRPTA